MPRISTNDGIQTTNEMKWIKYFCYLISSHILERRNAVSMDMLLFRVENFSCAWQHTFILFYFIFCCCLNWLHKIVLWISFRLMSTPAKKFSVVFFLSSFVWKVMELIESFVFSFIIIENRDSNAVRHKAHIHIMLEQDECPRHFHIFWSKHSTFLDEWKFKQY